MLSAGVAGGDDRCRRSDAGCARSDLTPGGVHRIRRFGGRSDPGLLKNQRCPEGSARGAKPHGRVDDRVPGVCPGIVPVETGTLEDQPRGNLRGDHPSRARSSEGEPAGPKTGCWSRSCLFRPPRPCEPPNRAAPRASYGGLPTNRMVEGAQSASVRTRLALDRVALRRVFRPGA